MRKENTTKLKVIRSIYLGVIRVTSKDNYMQEGDINTDVVL